MPVETLLTKYPIISDQIDRQALKVVLQELAAVLAGQVPGDIAEFGCYIGSTSLFIRRLLDGAGQSGRRQFYAYDSFAGLPEKTAPDASPAGEAFTTGQLKAGKKQFLRQFQRAGLIPPNTHKAWFNELEGQQLPAQLAFAFLDGDFYESILQSLRLAWPRLSPGGRLTIDDYGRESLPGVKRAVNDFFGNRTFIRHQQGIAIIHKP